MELGAAVAGAALVVDPGAEPAGGAQHRHLGRIALRLRRPRRGGRCCRPPSRSPGRAAEAGPGRAASLSRSSSPPGSQIRVARIRFSVSVPVLSVQITSVEPSVSTALRRLTTAPWRTSPRTPTARASVITGSSPSGTLPTSSPIANTTASENGSPAPKAASGTKAMPIATAIAAISQATRRTWRSSGLSSTSTRCESAAIRPSSVAIPVAKTSARASPAGAGGAAEDEVARLQARGIGVRLDRRRARPAPTRRSGSRGRPRSRPRRGGRRRRCGRPPRSAARRRGPGRRRRPAVSRPSRSTLACCGQVALQRLDRALGLRSWTKAKAALRTITTTTAIATGAIPAIAASAAAPQSSSASGWVNCRASSRGQRRPWRRSQPVRAVVQQAPLGLAAGKSFHRPSYRRRGSRSGRCLEDAAPAPSGVGAGAFGGSRGVRHTNSSQWRRPHPLRREVCAGTGAATSSETIGFVAMPSISPSGDWSASPHHDLCWALNGHRGKPHSSVGTHRNSLRSPA